MGIMRRADQKFRIDQKLGRLPNIANFNRIHVVDVNSLMNIVSVADQITAKVSGNHEIPESPPLVRVIEPLIQVTLKPKRFPAHLSAQLQIFKAF